MVLKNENENLDTKPVVSKSVDNKKTKICKFYNTEKGCDRGEKCKFLHQIIEQNKDTKTGKKDTNNNQINDSVIVNSPSTNTNTNTNTNITVTSNSKVNSTATEKKYCKFYNTSAGCRKGEKCQFIHEINSEITTTTNENTSNSTKNSNRRRRNRKQSKDAKNETEERNESDNESEDIGKNEKENMNKTNARTGNSRNNRNNRNNKNDTNENGNNRNNKNNNNNNRNNRNDTNENGNSRNNNRNNKNNKKNNEEKNEENKKENSQDKKDTITNEVIHISMPEKVNSDRKPMSRPKPINADKKSTREIEMEQLKRRYIKSYRVVSEIDALTRVMFEFTPTDPEFPFDLDYLLIELTIPMTYPIGTCKITKIINSDVPDHLLKNVMTYFNRKANITPRLPLVNLLNWLDHNLEYLLIERESVPSVSISFVSNTKSQSTTPQPKQEEEESNEDDDDDSDEDDDSDDDEDEDFDNEANIEEINKRVRFYNENNENSSGENSEQDENNDDNYDDDDQKMLYSENTEGLNSKYNDSIKKNDGENISNPTDTSNIRKGIQIRLINIKMLGISLIQCSELNLSVRCTRCKNTIDFLNVKPLSGNDSNNSSDNSAGSTDKKNVYWNRCETCRNSAGIRFRSEFLHQGNLSLGFIDLDGCEPFDFLPSDYIIQCEKCNTDQPVMKKIKRSQDNDTFCKKCHAHMVLNIDQVKYIRHGQSDKLEGSDSLPMPQLKKKEKNRDKDKGGVQILGISEGKPLPNTGVCKHYRKSHRWLRFPCCNKVYPCDICHEQSSNGHEMKWANRMICGYCSKEQPYSDKPCSCGKRLTRKNTMHGFWQGGEGNRDQVRMNRDDNRRYTGKTKTESKKSLRKKGLLKPKNDVKSKGKGKGKDEE